MAYLTTESGDQPQLLQFDLEVGETTIGRHPDCTIVVDAGAVSRFHAKVVRNRDEHSVADAGSRNGTFLNGQLLGGSQPLRHGDKIRVSEVEFIFHGDDAPEFATDDQFAGTSGFAVPDQSSAVPNRSPGDSPPSSPDSSSQEMTFDGTQFGIVMVDEGNENQGSKIDFQSSADGVKMVATPEAKLKALMQINRHLGNTLALDEVLPGVLNSLFDIFPAADRGFVVMETPDGGLIPRWVKTRRRDDDDTVRISRTIVREVMSKGETILSFDAADDSRFDSSQSIADFSIRSLMCAPLVDAEGRAFGALQIDSTQGRGQFRDEDVDLFAGVAGQAGVLINNSTMHEQAIRQKEVEQDLKLATDVQKAFLPLGPPDAPGFDVTSFYKAANHIGGDYYDYIHLPDGRVAIVLADVVGHGVAAAMFMAKLSAETRFCLAIEPNIAKAVEKLNDHMSRLLVERFITLVLVVIDPKDSAMTIVNAGHMPPIVRRQRDGSIVEPGEEESGLPIAIDEGMDYEAVRFELEVGDLVVLYTDGINEAMNAADEEFGMERVRKITANGDTAESVTKDMVDQVLAHIGDAAPFDDMCLVAIQRTADALPPPLSATATAIDDVSDPNDESSAAPIADTLAKTVPDIVEGLRETLSDDDDLPAHDTEV